MEIRNVAAREKEVYNWKILVKVPKVKLGNY